MPARRVSTTRRGALSGALGLVLVSACDVDDLRPPEDEAEPTPAPSSSPAPEPDADARLVEDVVEAIGVAAAYVVGARNLPRLSKQLGPMVRMHDTHLETLGAEPFGTDQLVIPSSPAEGLRVITEQEQLLQRALTSAAVSAQSGTLARLLASMSASVSQHLAVLPTPPTAEGQP